MASNSEPSEAPRKTLDEIRREIDAEYTVAAAARDDVSDRPLRDARAEQRMAAAWSEREDVDDTTDAPVSDFRTIADRHRALGRRRDITEDRPWRSGYLIAGLVGCAAGQVLLLAFLTVARYGWPDGATTAAALRPRTEAVVSAAVPPAEDDRRPAPQSAPRADAPAASPTSPWSPTTPQPESKPDGSEVLAALAAEPRVSSPALPAVVSSATIADGTPRPAGGAPRVAREPRASSPRSPSVLSASERLDAQARLRSALTQWHRASASGDVAVQIPEPVIVLSPDGRTAKTYVSLPSPIGLIPREQRWELGPGGWNLIDDRQAGLPMSGTAPVSRER